MSLLTYSAAQNELRFSISWRGKESGSTEGPCGEDSNRWQPLWGAHLPQLRIKRHKGITANVKCDAGILVMFFLKSQYSSAIHFSMYLKITWAYWKNKVKALPIRKNTCWEVIKEKKYLTVNRQLSKLGYVCFSVSTSEYTERFHNKNKKLKTLVKEWKLYISIFEKHFLLNISRLSLENIDFGHKNQIQPPTSALPEPTLK